MPNSEPVNVLYLSYDGMTDPLGQSQVIPYLEGLSKLGYSFTLISFEKAERYAKYRAEIEERLSKSNISWQPLSYTKKPPVLSTIWDVQRMKRKALALHRSKQFKIIHCRGYISALVGLAMKRELGVKFIFDMRGFYADERVDGGLWHLNNPIYKAVYDYFKKKEKEFLSEADYTVSLTHNGEGVIHCWTEIKGQPVPIQVIPCCADLDRFSQAAIDKAKLAELRQQFSIKEDDFILSYLGSIGTWYMPDEMLDFFKCLLQHRPDARFLFITPDDKKHILDLAISKGLSADKFIITAAPHKLVPTYLSLSTASLFFIKPVFSKRASSPTKQGEIMGLGIPQVCNANVGDINEIVDEKTGVLVHNFATTDYEAAVKSLLNSPYNPAYIRERAKFFYSLTGGVENYASVYRQIT